MRKIFSEVFPTLKISGQLNTYVKELYVERISSTKNRDILRIYTYSEYVIEKEHIYKLEELIKKQLFPKEAMVIKIYEKFALSSQYNARTMIEAYLPSMLLEFHNYSPMIYMMLKTAQFSYEDENKINICLKENVTAKMKEKEFVDILDKILGERCGLNIGISITYEKQEDENRFEEDDIAIERQVEEIRRRANIGQSEDDESEQGVEENKESGNQDGLVAQSGNGKEENIGQKIMSSSSTEKTAQPSQKNNSSAKSGRGERFLKKTATKSDNPDVIFGKDILEETITIDQIIGEMGEVVIKGKVLSVDLREIVKIEKTIISFKITDFTDTIVVKMFCPTELVGDITGEVKKGVFLKVKGVAMLDKYDHDLTVSSIYGIKKIPDFTSSRMDYALHKRVELHCHTKMSDMDGVTDAKALIKRAYEWGHKALAITDHGVAQAYPEAFHTWEDLWRTEKGKRKEAGDENPDRQDFFKVIYGIEGYLVDDLKEIVKGAKEETLDSTFVVFDLETTGFSPISNKIIEIGAVKIRNNQVIDEFSRFVNPLEPIPFHISQLTSIRDEDVMDAKTIEEILPEFLEFSKDCVMVAHNAGFDMSFIVENAKRQGFESSFVSVDTVGISRVLLPHLSKHKLNNVAKELKIPLENHHRAVDDAQACAQIFMKFIPMLLEEGIRTLEQINGLALNSVESTRKLPSNHVIILAKTNVGRVNLYHLISESHLNYYYRRPKIPKSLIYKFREDLIIGSACEAGELYQAIINEKSEQELARIINFYDYLEIQPTGNNAFMLKKENSKITTVEQLEEINRYICKLGERYHKPVCATCDVHFMDPSDELYRKIIMAGKGFSDADDQAPLYLRTTEEMLEEFAYLGSDKAKEVVVTNTNLIADMIESIDPVRPDKCAPIIEDSDKTLTDICYNKAHELYGKDLPIQVEQRLEKELHSIITNGFAVMYIIAQKLVWKSVEDGYLVGSRGSVGSSFVATMSGITEVNPLSPHYYCGECFYSDFESDEVRAYAGMAGCDMPDKACPKCGAMLKKDGFDIPFETFLGFKGDKEPDIDLNFSGEYQAKAHKYTEVIFGAGQTYRAGTIGTLAEKTAFGYVKKYYEERGSSKRNCEIERIVEGCTGIRRSTGQHPGGIIVLPLGEDICSFTPIQHPANDMTTDIVTTHFDYHSIDHNLLKLDILGHDDPTMIRMLEDLTGIDAVAVALDDPDVMSLFQSTKALGITPDQIGGCPVGSLGIPEFGTDFVIQMLVDTKPKSFSDLVRISGLSHGTDVWLGNAQTLIEEGQATISTAICTRDDIMTYLINTGVESSLSFTIMESVRKGKGLKPEWEEAMLQAGVPEWYIWSCKKIKYMFPKAHAAAYVMMAWRIAYCKVNYPLAYYAAYFSIRASAFDYGIMCQGQSHLEYVMADYEKRKDTLSKKEQDTQKDMRIVQEMYARGFEFEKIDLFRAHARLFQIIDGKLMPSFATIENLGEKAAETLMQAAKDGPFISKDDLRQRSKLSKTVIETMTELQLLGDLPESNQISLFDFG